MIPVTKPFLPPLEEYTKYLEEIWDRNWLTNNGPFVNMFELNMKKYLQTNSFVFVGNGTLALQLAIKSLNLNGEVITTPFSYVATTSSLVWENCKPVFVDIEKQTLNINPELITRAITDKTTAILATHVFGNPCNVDEIQKIADEHNLKVIYDASHCFGVEYKGQSRVITSDLDLAKELTRLRNFGHNGPEKFDGVGINAKNSELHAAMGLANLKYADHILNKREKDSKIYDTLLLDLPIQKIKITEGTKYNYSYYPIILRNEEECLKVFNRLNDEKVYSRRYFYPTLNTLEYLKYTEMTISEDIASRILCLPLYEQLNEYDIHFICRIISQTIIK